MISTIANALIILSINKSVHYHNDKAQIKELQHQLLGKLTQHNRFLNIILERKDQLKSSLRDLLYKS